MGNALPHVVQTRRKTVIMGAAGRDFHDFNVRFRDDAQHEVVAFTAAQIPDIAARIYPPLLAGALYPDGIPIVPEAELDRIVRDEVIDLVVLAYSDLAHEDVMHKASIALAAGASFELLGPRETMLRSDLPVISVGATRTGAGKSPVARFISSHLLGRGYRAAVIRHPMPYGDLERQAVQRFATPADLDIAECTIEEREEYEPHLRAGAVVFAGVDYERILERAEEEADVILWDGGNNDFPFIEPDLHIVLADPHRAGHEMRYHPGEANLRMADVIIVSKVGSAKGEDVAIVEENARAANPRAPLIHGDLAISLPQPADLAGKRVVVVEDGPTTTHGGMGYGAGVIAAKRAGAHIVDPRPWARGSIAEAYREFPHLAQVVPALGYGPAQVDELRATLESVPCDAILDATPVALQAILHTRKRIIEVDYEYVDLDGKLADVLLGFEDRELK